MLKRIIFSTIITIAAVSLANAKIEIDTAIEIGFPLSVDKFIIKSPNYDFEEKSKSVSFSGFNLNASAYIGKKDFPVCFYGALGFGFGTNKSEGDYSISGTSKDLNDSKSSSFSGTFLIGPGFRFQVKENLKINFAPALNIRWGFSKNDNGTTTQTTNSLYLGGGIDFHLRIGNVAKPFSFVIGSKFIFNKIVSYKSDSMDASFNSIGFYNITTDGIIFTWQPYLGFGYRF